MDYYQKKYHNLWQSSSMLDTCGNNAASPLKNKILPTSMTCEKHPS